MRTWRSMLRSLVGAAGAVLLLAGVANAKTIYKFAFVTPNSPDDPYARTGLEFAKALEELLPGEFEIKLFPDRQLGDEKELIEGVRIGTIDAAVITNSLVANVAPAFGVNDLPFLYADSKAAYRVLDSDLGATLLQQLNKLGIVGLGFPENGFRSMMNNKKAVLKPEDVVGVKYRVAPSPVYIQMFDALGGSAVPMAWAEVPLSVQKGAIDGLELPMPVAYTLKMYELVKYVSLTKHTYSALVLMMSKRAYDKLPPESQEKVRKAAKLAIDRQRQHIGGLVDKSVNAFREHGVAVNDVPELALFRDRMKPIYNDFQPKLGDDLMNRWTAAAAGK
jgi:tripartite ATP-independent transporter DctP family solute receptor